MLSKTIKQLYMIVNEKYYINTSKFINKYTQFLNREYFYWVLFFSNDYYIFSAWIKNTANFQTVQSTALLNMSKTTPLKQVT